MSNSIKEKMVQAKKRQSAVRWVTRGMDNSFPAKPPAPRPARARQIRKEADAAKSFKAAAGRGAKRKKARVDNKGKK